MRRIGLSLAVIALATLLLWAWRALDVQQAPPASGTRVDPTVAAERPNLDLTDASAIDAQRQSAPVEVAPSPTAERPARPPAAIVRGRCVDESALPLAGIDVQLVRYTCGDSKHAEWVGSKPTMWITQAGPPVTRATSDEQGRFAIALGCDAPARVLVLVVAARTPGRTTCVRFSEVAEDLKEIDVGDLVLVRSATLSGSVRDEAGRAIDGATLVVLGKDRKDTGSTAKSRPDGTFLLDDAPAGAISVYARLEDQRSSSAASRVLAPGDRADGIELVVPLYEDPNAISGVVLGVDGIPLAGAAVNGEFEREERGVNFLYCITDEGGRFRAGANPSAKFWLRATHPHEEATPAVLENVASGQHGLVMRLTPLRTCVVNVRDEMGAPVTRFGLRTQTKTPNRTLFGKMDEESDRPDGVATFALDAVPFWIELSAAGFEIALVGPLDPATLGPVVEATMKRMPALRGRVTSSGQPVAGALVAAVEALGELEIGRIEPFDELSTLCKGCPETKSDSEGGYTILLTKSGRWHARVQHAGDPTQLSAAIEIRPGLEVPAVDFDLGPRGTIEGQVRRESGEAVPDTLVGASCGDGFVLTATSDSRGRFRFEPLAPRAWQVRELPKGWTLATAPKGVTQFPRRMPDIVWDCTVTDGTTTSFDVVVPSPANLEVELTPPLSALGSWSVTAWKKAANFAATPTDQAGVMRVDLPSSRMWWVIAKHEHGGSNLIIQEEIDVLPGASRHVVRLVAGSLRGSVREPGAYTTIVHMNAASTSPRVVRARAVLAADGTFVFPVAPAGEVELSVEGRNGVATRVVVVAGQDNDAGEI